MQINTLYKIYIAGQLQERGIIVRLEELDQLKDELLPFAKAQLEYRKKHDRIPEQEQPYAEKMAQYFGIEG